MVMLVYQRVNMVNFHGLEGRWGNWPGDVSTWFSAVRLGFSNSKEVSTDFSKSRDIYSYVRI